MKPYDYQCILEVDPDAPLSLSAIKFEISKHMEWPVELSFTELRLGIGGQAMKYAAIDWNVDGKVPRKVRVFWVYAAYRRMDSVTESASYS